MNIEDPDLQYSFLTMLLYATIISFLSQKGVILIVGDILC